MMSYIQFGTWILRDRFSLSSVLQESNSGDAVQAISYSPLWRLAPGQQVRFPQLLAHAPHSGIAETLGRAKVRKKSQVEIKTV